ncbi:MAG: hypothetical protein WCP21_00305 [Armatimonadota bacterium]
MTYEVKTADGRHRFRVNALTGQMTFYTNLAAERALREQRASEHGADPKAEGLAEQRKTRARELFPFFDLSQTVLMNRSWNEFVSPGVLSGNSFTVDFIPESLDIRQFVYTYRAVNVASVPFLSADECRKRALQMAAKEACGAEATVSEKTFQRQPATQYATVFSDEAGVQRLGHLVPVTTVRVRDNPAVGQDQRTRFIFVDARNGECLDPDIDLVGSRLLGDERSPVFYVGHRELDRFGPMFPPRVRGKIAYLYVGYLSSVIWRGVVNCRPDTIEIAYEGHTWHFDGNGKALRDAVKQSFKAPPMQLAGYWYLPLDTVQAITGWNVRYLPADGVVKVYSRLEAQPK